MHRAATVVATTLALASTATAQGFGNAWLVFEPGPAPLTGVQISDATTEAHFATGDLDQDGWTDVVVVRTQSYTMPGKRRNVLLMNEQGVLVDRADDYAAASSVAGDQGFLTPTSARDAAIVDVDGDGWLDVVTTAQFGSTDPKHVSHPRVYRNLGLGGSGQWLGLVHEDARFPQLFSFTTGLATSPNFSAVGAGDVNGDGAPDLWFTDHDFGAPEAPGTDTNDRLLLNDGNGFFTDASQALVTAPGLLSSFGSSAAIVDMNGDGANDLLKVSFVLPPQNVSVIYGDAVTGQFALTQSIHMLAGTQASAADLNRDGRVDVVITDDGIDRFRINTGNDALGRVIWAPLVGFGFLFGADDGFGGPSTVADLDGDGWNDVLVADQDFAVPGATRRLHLYHNRGGAVGGTPSIVEERESMSATGWIGAIGLSTTAMMATYDTAVLDLDGDGDLDLLVARHSGVDVHLNAPFVCQQDLGGASPGGATLKLCGAELSSGGQASLQVLGTLPNVPVQLGIAAAPTPFPLFGGTLIGVPVATVLLPANAQGEALATVTGFGPAPDLYLQAAHFDASFDAKLTNALRVELP